MNTINVRFSSSDKVKVQTDGGSSAKVNLGGYKVVREYDYEKLKNRPSINSILLEGNISLQQLGLRAVYYDTTAAWNSMPSMVGEEGAIYIYSDHQEIIDELGNKYYIPGIRIGDGKAYLIDLPFLSDALTEAFYDHITNTSIHISAEERDFWNNKVSSYLDADDHENLVLSKTTYVTEGDIYNG